MYIKKQWILAGVMTTMFFIGGFVAQLVLADSPTAQAAENRYMSLGWGDNNMDKLWVLDTNTGDVNYISLDNMKDNGPTRTFFFKKTP